MEQFLLSPDVAVQRTPQTQAVNNSAAENGGDDFTPIMEEAVAGQQSLTDNQQEHGNQNQAELSEGSAKDGISELAPASVETALRIQPVTAEILNQNVQNQSQQPTTLPSPPLPATAPPATAPPATEIVEPEFSTQGKVESPSLIADPTAKTVSTSKAETILLQQIQQIIDEGNNIGAITIKSSNTVTAGNKEQIDNLQMLSSPVLNETEAETIQVRQSTIAQLLPGEQKTFTANSSKPESSRQEVTEQFLNAKIGEAQKNSQGQTTNQQSDQKGNNGQNKDSILNATSSATPIISETSPGETSFSYQLRSSEISTNPTTVSVEGKFAPGATQIVPEKELIDNLVQRFNVNPRLQTSKLTLQLHPAELGQLKIDILVKGDSISANIVAQSQQALETLEKHMNRLRGVLEDQGFNIDTFEITLQADSDNQQNLFQEHFDSQQQFATNSRKTSGQPEDSFDTLLDSEELDSLHEKSGLNVTA